MKPDNRYVSYLDGLRGYSILLVVAGHLNVLKIYFARFGVTVFFFVSGFLITKLLIYEYYKHNAIDLKSFYIRRFFRLYPALIFMIATTCLILVGFGFRIILPDILSGLFYFTNYYIAYFKPPAPEKYLMVSNILWSLSVEEHFYLFFPLLFSFLFPKGRKFLNTLCALLVAFLALRLFTTTILPEERYRIVNYFTTHGRGDSILYGCVSALFLFRYESRWYINLLNSKMVFYSSVLLLAVTLATTNIFFSSTFAYSLYGIGLFFAVPSFSFAQKQGWVHDLVDNRLMVYIGKLSYSLYLFHWVAFNTGNLLFRERSLNWYLFVIPAALALSLISYYWVEKPFQALRKKFGSNVPLSK